MEGEKGACVLMIKEVISKLLMPVYLIRISFITGDQWPLWTAELPLMNKWEKSDIIVKKEYGYDKG